MTLALEQEAFATHNTAPPISAQDSVKRVQVRAQLAEIRETQTALVIWQRALSSPLRRWIEGLAPEALPHFRIRVSTSDIRAALEHELENAGHSASAMRDAFIEDVAALAVTYAEITGSDQVDLRLERIEHDACWKFHRDMVKARLLTTYRGVSTEWVAPDHAERAIAEQTAYSGPLERLETEEVAIFKGAAKKPENGPNHKPDHRPDQGIVHRSPPIQGTGETRLLLCLNEPSLVSPNLWTR